MNTKILNPNLDVVITASGKVKIVTEIGGKLVAINDRKLHNKLLYTASKKPQSWWIDANCYDNVYDENTGEGYLLLNPNVTVLAGISDDENEIWKNIFSNALLWDEEPDIIITNVVVPNQITSIKDNALAIVQNEFVTITLPETITLIDNYGVAGESDPEYTMTLIVNAKIPPSACGDIYEGINSIYECYVPAESYDDYVNDECWSNQCRVIIPMGAEFAKMYFSANEAPDSSWIQENCILPLCHFDDGDGYLAIKDGVTRLYGNEGFKEYESMFDYPNSVTSVTIPSQITTIGELSFVNCHALESVEIPESVTSIEEYAFSSCDALTSFVCKAVTPPTLTGEHIFDSLGTTTCIVPNDTAVTNYQNSEWANYFTTFTEIS